MNNISKKENCVFAILFIGIVCAVFFDVVSLRKTFLKGDYLQQFFPWYEVYASNLKTGHLTFWMKEIQCGFPLFAEGQIGQLYPLNVLFFLLLPFKAAYNYSFIFHFIIGGMATYFFARRKGACLLGGLLSAILISFGSVYSGCFVNISAMKTLVWFPFVLMLYDIYLSTQKKKFILFAGLILGLQCLAGSMQMSLYSAFFYAIYFFYQNHEKGNNPYCAVKDIILVGMIAALVSLPQTVETYILSGFSNRAARTVDFALWNSLSPVALTGTVLPSIGSIFSRGNMIYVGSLSLFFAMIAVWLSKDDRRQRISVIFLAVALFFALGKFNPLYVVALKISGFYSMRAPSRFLYFAVFALAILSGIGFTYFLKNRSCVPNRIIKIFTGLICATVGVIVAARLTLIFFGEKILTLAKDYVSMNIYGKPFHRYDIDVYMAKTEGIYNAIVKNFSFNNFDLWMSICFLIGAVFLVCVGTVYFLRSKKFIGIICLCYVAAELLYFSNFSVGVWPELDDFNSVLPREQKIYQKIKNDADNFRICPFGEFSKMPFWIRPAMNAVYGIDSISIYTPLADSRYFFMMEGLGTVDDSMGIFPADKGALYKKLNMLSELNVKYIVSTMDLSDPSLEFVLKENKIYLYQLKKFVSRYRFRTNVVSGNAPSFDLLVEKETSGLSMLKIFSENGGRLVFAQKCYPGWEVLVDGQKQVPEFSNGVLQGVVLSGGVHNVIFRYRPICFNVFFPISLTIFIVVALLAITGDRKDE